MRQGVYGAEGKTLHLDASPRLARRVQPARARFGAAPTGDDSMQIHLTNKKRKLVITPDYDSYLGNQPLAGKLQRTESSWNQLPQRAFLQTSKPNQSTRGYF